MFHGLACHFWCTRNFLVRSIVQQTLWLMQIGIVIRPTFNPGQTRPKWPLFECSIAVREYNFRLHIVHLSTCHALEELRGARSEGLSVSVETCPHYLHLAAETIANGATPSKCAPPIRSREKLREIVAGTPEGTIDLVVTDHSPCPPTMKRLHEGSFRTAWGGIASLSVALPLMWTEASRRGFTLLDLARWMAAARLDWLVVTRARVKLPWDTMRISLFSIPTWNSL